MYLQKHSETSPHDPLSFERVSGVAPDHVTDGEDRELRLSEVHCGQSTTRAHFPGHFESVSSPDALTAASSTSDRVCVKKGIARYPPNRLHTQAQSLRAPAPSRAHHAAIPISSSRIGALHGPCDGLPKILADCEATTRLTSLICTSLLSLLMIRG